MQIKNVSARSASIAPTTQHQNEVPMQLGALDGQLQQLEKNIDDLRGRISPVLADRPLPESEAPNYSPCDSGLARNIQGFAMRLENLNMQMASIFSRIEL